MKEQVEAVEQALLSSETPVRSAADLHRGLDDETLTKNDVLSALNTLRDIERVGREKVGANAVAWWHVDRVTPPKKNRDRRARRETPGSRGSDTAPGADEPSPHTPESTPDAGDSATQEPEPPDVDARVSAAVDAIGADWDDDARLENRKRAATEVLQHAVTTGEGVGRSSDVFEMVLEKYPVQGQNEETYWRKNIRPVLKEFGEYSKATKAYSVESLPDPSDL